MATQTQGQVLLAAQRKLYELNTNRFSEPTLRGWINEAMADMARRAQALRDTDTVSAVVGTQEYSAPADALAIHAIRYTPTGQPSNTVDLEYTDYKNVAQIGFGLASHQNTPQIFWTWGYSPTLKFNVYPTPSVAGTFLLHYYTTPTPLATETAGDANVNLPIVQGWEDLIVDYCVYQAMLSDRDSRWEAYKGIYEQKIGALADTSVRYTDQMGMISVGRSHVPQWLWDPFYE